MPLQTEGRSRIGGENQPRLFEKELSYCWIFCQSYRSSPADRR